MMMMSAATKDSTGALPPTEVSWGERLARGRRHTQEAAQAGGVRVEHWIPGAIRELRTLFDEAALEANAALEEAGLADRIEQDGRYFRLRGPHSQGYIAISISLRAVDGQASGGAEITSSETRAIIHLTPRETDGTVCWIVRGTGAAFTGESVHDLFLSVFGDEPGATARLLPCFSLEECV
jgi:hypothetical protein